MSKVVQQFIDQLNRPFDYHTDGRLPDGYPNNTTKLVDYYDGLNFSLPATSATQTIIGIGFYLTYGANVIVQQAKWMNGSSGSSPTGAVNMGYGFEFFLIGTAGTILSYSTLAAVAPQQREQIETIRNVMEEKYLEDISEIKTEEDVGATAIQGFMTYGTTNYTTIMGGTSNNNYNRQTATAQAVRILSAGMRMLPTIEVVTNSSTVAIQKYYGCQITPNQLYDVFASSTNVLTTLKELPSYFETNNARGISGRFQFPLHTSYSAYWNMMPIDIIASTNYNSFDNDPFPVLCAYFNTSITTSITVPTSLPFNFDVRFTFESVLETPTPIMGSRPPYDPTWKNTLCNYNYSVDKFPTITEGHSFKAIMGSLFTVLANNTYEGQLLRRAYSGLQQYKQHLSQYDNKYRMQQKRKPNVNKRKNVPPKGKPKYKMVYKPKQPQNQNANVYNMGINRANNAMKKQSDIQIVARGPRFGRARSRSMQPRGRSKNRTFV
jgi:hypothetical protein